MSSFRFGTNLYDDSFTQTSCHKELPGLIARNKSDQVAVHTCRNFQPPGITTAAYESAKSSFYRNLRPVDKIQETINGMQRQHFDGFDVTGVHIRRNDHLTFMKKDHRLVCPTSMFVKAMENVLRTNPGTKFFLATDDKNEEALIMRLFPGAVIVYEKEKPSRDTAKGMQDALVDWVLLSKTSRIIAPYASSYSEEAGAVNRIKTEVVVREDELSKIHFKILFLTPIRLHYQTLREEGLKRYFLYAFSYRKRWIMRWIKKIR